MMEMILSNMPMFITIAAVVIIAALLLGTFIGFLLSKKKGHDGEVKINDTTNNVLIDLQQKYARLKAAVEMQTSGIVSNDDNFIVIDEMRGWLSKLIKPDNQEYLNMMCVTYMLKIAALMDQITMTKPFWQIEASFSKWLALKLREIIVKENFLIAYGDDAEKLAILSQCAFLLTLDNALDDDTDKLLQEMQRTFCRRLQYEKIKEAIDGLVVLSKDQKVQLASLADVKHEDFESNLLEMQNLIADSRSKQCQPILKDLSNFAIVDSAEISMEINSLCYDFALSHTSFFQGLQRVEEEISELVKKPVIPVIKDRQEQVTELEVKAEKLSAEDKQKTEKSFAWLYKNLFNAKFEESFGALEKFIEEKLMIVAGGDEEDFPFEDLK